MLELATSVGLRRRARILAGVAALAAALLAAGCDQQRIEKLEEGVATEADVRRQFGEPAATYTEADGSRTLEFPRQPEGQSNYMITIGGDGRMSALRQVVRPDVFAKVRPGLDKAEVRRLLGRPAKTQTFALKQEEAWDWRYHAEGENRLFVVLFDMAGKVTGTQTLLDPKGTDGGAANR